MRAALARSLILLVCLLSLNAAFGLGMRELVDEPKVGLRRASRQADQTLSLELKDDWTQLQVDEAVCEFTYTGITLSQVGAKNFYLPGCAYDFPLEDLILVDMVLPNMTILPTTLKSLWITGVREMPTSDWSWDFLERLTSLDDLILFNMGIDAEFPLCVNVSKLQLSINRLRGEISENFFSCSPSLTNLVAAKNRLTGTVPYKSFALQALDLSNNMLTHWPDLDAQSVPSNLLFVSLSNNRLASIPSAATWANMTNLNAVYLDNNYELGLNGFMPPVDTSRNHRLQFYFLLNCSFTGPLPEMIPKNADSGNVLPFRIWQFSDNKFNGPIPTSWYNYSWSYLNLANNYGINGTFPNNWFAPAMLASNNMQLSALDLSNTALSGPMRFDLLGTYHASFSNAYTLIMMRNMRNMDFCDENIEFVPWNRPDAVFSCDLRGTNAHQCHQRYNACLVDFSPPSAVPEPTFTTAPPSTCPPAPSGLDLNFYDCINGRWVHNGTITSPTFFIPANIEVFVVGSITSTEIVVQGSSATITIIDGCADNLKQVTVEFSADDIEKLSKEKKSKDFSLTLLSLEGESTSNCTNNLGKVNIKTKSKGCKEVKVQKNTSSSKTLSAVFRIDTTRCNLWWIILLSVIGGLLIIAVIVIALVAAFVPSFRQKIRPFSKRSRPQPAK